MHPVDATLRSQEQQGAIQRQQRQQQQQQNDEHESPSGNNNSLPTEKQKKQQPNPKQPKQESAPSPPPLRPPPSPSPSPLPSSKVVINGRNDGRNGNNNAKKDSVVYESHKRITTTRVSVTSVRRLGSTLGAGLASRRRQAQEALTSSRPTSPLIDVDQPEIPPPIQSGPPSICNVPPPLNTDNWSSMGGSTFAVRGENYMDDKIKVASDRNLFRLLAVDIVNAASRLPQNSVCLHPEERVQKALRREAEGGEGEGGGDTKMPAFVFCVNICMPSGSNTSSGNGNGNGIGMGRLSRSGSVDGAVGDGNNGNKNGNNYGNGNGGTDSAASSQHGTNGTNGGGSSGGHPHLVAYYGIDDLSLIDGSDNASSPESKLLQRFFFGADDEFRHSTFKLLPRIAQGNVVVRKAVGSKPAIMGRKLKQTYVRGERFLEVVIDVTSSQVATKIVKLSLSYAKTLVVDMAFILEGKDSDVLPERVMGSLRLKNVDFKNSLRPVVV